MALLPTAAGRGTLNMIEQIKACLEDIDHNGTNRRHIGGRMKRERLAAIASSKLDLEASNKHWVGHALALLCESLEASVINEIMTQGHGRYKKEWDKWELAEGLPKWHNRRGEDRIRNLVYDLLMEDLIILYKGYEVDGGEQVKGLSVKGVCKKVKDEIGIVAIKDSYLRDQLERHGATRNLKGQAVVPTGRNTKSVGSPSTLGASTPTSSDIPSVSPRLNHTGLLPPGVSDTRSRLPTPTRYVYGSGGVSSRSNTTALTQGPSQSQLSKNTNHYPQSRMTKFSKTIPFQQRSSQNSRDTAFPLSPASGHPNPIPPPIDATLSGIDDGSHNCQPIPNSFHLIPSGNGHSGHGSSQSFAPIQGGGWLGFDGAGVAGQALTPISNMDEISRGVGPSVSLSLPLTGTAVAQFNDALTQLPEKIELLTRRLDTERMARVLLEARANEVDKWQKEYMRIGKNYEELTSHCESQERHIKDLKQKSEHLEGLCKTFEDGKVSEQTKREKLSDDMENLQQKYHALDGTVQRLRNADGELQSKVLSLQGLNEIQAEHINGLQTGLKKLEVENTDLRIHLSDLQNHNHSLRIEVTKLQTANSQLIGRVGKLKDENIKLDRTVEALQQQKNNFQNDVAKLQTQNLKLQTQVAQLHEAKVNLDEKVDLLERESASFQQEKRALEINPSQECVSRFSTCTIDSGVGESLRASVASSRKRQISITDEREEKRHRSLNFMSGNYSTFLADPDPDELPIMSTSELPIRRGSEGSTHNKAEEWI
ncbi:uncharacterized protein PAC_14711 [Phialocephala subalpina]|uniref:Uncharacterized protein n=1 Tax=Phialocephala subalpina TaxID=576137 RepID=A0A1L7XIF0_9HELO|nr:uncharacterized protein PAC_14711 [Phialocephala subalpina]